MSHQTINGQQCKDARQILRWNLKDLSYKSSVSVQRLQRFEAAREQLFPDEQQHVMAAFSHEHIVFSEGGGVAQKKPKKQQQRQARHEQSPTAERVLARLLNK